MIIYHNVLEEIMVDQSSESKLERLISPDKVC
jgi:hypothetical protein